MVLWAAVFTAGPACGLDSEGLTDGPPDLGGSSGSASEGSSGTDDDTSSNSGSGSDSTTSSGESESTTTAGSDTSPGPAILELDPIFDFGPIQQGATLPASLQVTNTGGQAATAIDLPPIPSPFQITGGDCAPSLEPGASCTIGVQFAPVVLGPFEGTLRINYDNGPAMMQATAALTGRSTGTTGNLVVNPGAETGGSPPSGWAAAQGGNWGTTTSPVRSGSAAFRHGQSIIGAENRLEQAVDISAHSTAAETGNLEVAIQGFMIGEGVGLDSDSGTIYIEYRAAGGVPIEGQVLVEGSPGSWTEGNIARTVPPTTRQVVLMLQCTAIGTLQEPTCDVSFDDLSLVLTYD